MFSNNMSSFSDSVGDRLHYSSNQFSKYKLNHPWPRLISYNISKNQLMNSEYSTFCKNCHPKIEALFVSVYNLNGTASFYLIRNKNKAATAAAYLLKRSAYVKSPLAALMATLSLKGFNPRKKGASSPWPRKDSIGFSL